MNKQYETAFTLLKEGFGLEPFRENNDDGRSLVFYADDVAALFLNPEVLFWDGSMWSKHNGSYDTHNGLLIGKMPLKKESAEDLLAEMLDTPTDKWQARARKILGRDK